MTVRGGIRVAVLSILACNRVNQPPPAQPTSVASPNAPVVWSPSLGLDSLSAVSTHLATPFPEPFDVAVVGPDGLPKQASMPNCAAYFELRPKGYEPLAQPDMAAMKVAGGTCWALKTLETARAATVHPLRPFPLSQEALGRLPPVLGPTAMPADRDRRIRATSEGQAWIATDPAAKVLSKGDWRAQVRGKDWTTDLDILACGDLNGDGVDDLLVLTVSTGSEGSWSEVHLRLLSSVPGDPVLHVVKDYPL